MGENFRKKMLLTSDICWNKQLFIDDFLHSQTIAVKPSFMKFKLLLIFALFLVVFSCKKEKAPPTCLGVNPTGGFVKLEDGKYRYQNANGVDVELSWSAKGGMTLVFRWGAYTRLKMEWWGSVGLSKDSIYSVSHENVNGKHIKDRIGGNRSVLYPDGTKITMATPDPYLSATAVTIYDGDAVHHFNVKCGVIEYSAITEALAETLDYQQPDGETTRFEIIPGGLFVFNDYTEDTPGNKVFQRVDLARLVLTDPNDVFDYYDDPRLGHT